MKKSCISFIALLLCCVISLCSCTGYKEIEPSEADLTVVGQVGDCDVYLEELRFVAHTYRNMMTERYGEDIFEGENAETYLDMLRELVYANITYNYAVLLLCGEVGIKQGEELVEKKVDTTLTELVENELGSFSKYKKYLKENHLTDHFLRFSTEISILENELLYVYVDDLMLIEDDDEKVYDIITDEFILVRHVFIPHTYDSAKDTIGEIKQMSDSGTGFASLIDKYDQDPDMTANGIFILDGYMTEEYENVAYSLSVGEISDVVEDQNGYYLIERMQMSPSAVMLDFDSLKQKYQTYTFYSMIDEKQATLTFVPNDAGIDYMKEPF